MCSRKDAANQRIRICLGSAFRQKFSVARVVTKSDTGNPHEAKVFQSEFQGSRFRSNPSISAHCAESLDYEMGHLDHSASTEITEIPQKQTPLDIREAFEIIYLKKLLTSEFACAQYQTSMPKTSEPCKDRKTIAQH